MNLTYRRSVFAHLIDSQINLQQLWESRASLRKMEKF